MSFGGSLMILNTFICTKSVYWVAKYSKISRGVSLGLDLATTFKVYSDCTINIYVYMLINCHFVCFFFSTETWLEKRSNDINDPSSLNPGGICDSGLSLNRYLQAHSGDTGKCPSKLTAYISIVPTWYSKMYYVHICTCLWIFILYRSMLWVRVSCLCINASLGAHAYT